MKFRLYLGRSCNFQCKLSGRLGNSKKNNRLLSAQRKGRSRADAVRMASKYRCYRKQDATGRNITWNRDTNAARNIRYKGRCDMIKLKSIRHSIEATKRWEEKLERKLKVNKINNSINNDQSRTGY